ncbi:MAG: LamG-like jellyroll fold domain-containing protein [Bacteroidales bacterium]
MKKFYSLLILLTVLISGQALAQSNALAFDNVDDYVDVPNASSLITSATSLSLTCWVYPQNGNITWPDYDGFCGFRNNTNADFYLIQHAAVGVEARFRGAGGTNSDIVYPNLQINTWSHFVFTYDGAMIRLYVNGNLFGSAPASGSITNSAVPFYIGNLWYQTVQFFMNGKIDEVSLWNKALTQEEVNQVYHCPISPTASNLLLYYKFDQGIANGNNTAITALTPTTGTLNGVLHNFALTGTTSNFVEGTTSPIYEITETICNGESYQFGNQVLTAPGIYTESFPTPSGCDSIVELTLMVFTPNTAVTLSGVTLTAQQSGATYKWVNCNTGFSLIPGATGQSYTATANGSYAVIVTMNNCSDTSNCVAVTSVGMPEDAGTVIGCYPNPVEDILIIDLDRTYENIGIQIFSNQGQKLADALYHHGKTIRQDVSALPAGIYILKLEAGGKEVYRKVIK